MAELVMLFLRLMAGTYVFLPPIQLEADYS